jgi:hypothetical protein
MVMDGTINDLGRERVLSLLIFLSELLVLDLSCALGSDCLVTAVIRVVFLIEVPEFPVLDLVRSSFRAFACSFPRQA